MQSLPRITPSYKIFGNCFEQRAVSNSPRRMGFDSLVKRYFVSSEFIQLFYTCMDGGFSPELYQLLEPNEKFLLSKMVIYMKMPENREFNIFVSKFMRGIYERLRFIEAAIRAGNLSKALQTEYCEIMDKLITSGSVKKQHGAYQKCIMNNTPTTD